MKTFFRGLIDFVGLVVGPFFTAYYLLDFSHGPAGPGPYYYFYRLNSQLGVAFGVALICLGLVMRSWKRDADAQQIRRPKKRFYTMDEPKKQPRPDRKRPPQPPQETGPLVPASDEHTAAHKSPSPETKPDEPDAAETKRA